MKASVFAVCLLVVCPAVLAFTATENIQVIQSKTGIVCAGYDTASSNFYRFNNDSTKPQKLVYEVPNIQYEGDEWNVTAVINFCSDVQISDEDCTDMGKNNAAGYLKLKSTKSTSFKCLPLTNPDATPTNEWKFKSFVEGSNPKTTGFSFEKKDPTTAQVPIKPLFIMTCSTADQEKGSGAYNSANKTVTLTYSKKSFCGYSNTSMISTLNKSPIFTFLLLCFSIFMTFFGYKFVEWIMFAIGFLTASLLGGLVIAIIGIASIFADISTLDWISILILFILFCLCFGWLFSKLTRFALIAAGGLLGLGVGTKLFELIALGIGLSSPTVQSIIVILCVIGGAWLGYYIHDHVLILATAFGGGLFFTIALGVLLKSYPDAANGVYLKDLGQPGEEQRKKMVTKALIWNLLYFCITFLGAYVQYKKREENRKEGKSESGETDYLKHDSETSDALKSKEDEDSRL